MTESGKTSAQVSKCPTCKVPVARDGEFFPFCSKRCRLVDLGKWLDGDHRITRPMEEADLDQGE